MIVLLWKSIVAAAAGDCTRGRWIMIGTVSEGQNDDG